MASEEEINNIVKELKGNIANMLYDKLRIYGNVHNIKFRIDYDYVMTTSVIEDFELKKNSKWSERFPNN